MQNGHTAAPELVDLDDVATMFKCSHRTIQKFVAEGTLPIVKLPGSRLLRFRPSAIAEVLARFENYRSIRSPFDDGPGRAAA